MSTCIGLKSCQSAWSEGGHLKTFYITQMVALDISTISIITNFIVISLFKNGEKVEVGTG